MSPPHPTRPSWIHRLSALTWILIGSASTAWSLQNPFDSGPDPVLPWTGGAPGSTPPTPTRGVPGEFTGDLLADVIYLHGGGGASLVYGPGYYSATVPLSSTIRDLAKIPSKVEGAADKIAILDHEGLKRLSNYDAGSFTEVPVSLGAPWDQAQRIVVGDVTADGRADAVGVASDGVTILVREDAGAGGLPTSNFTVPFPVLDLLVLDWSPAPAIAILTTGGLVVRTWDGVSLADHIGGTFLAGRLVSFHQDGLPYERLATVYTAQGLGEFLSVVDRNGSGSILPLGNIGTYALAAGDIDRNLSDDLVVLQRTTHQALYFKNQNLPGNAFGAVEFVHFGPVGVGAGGQSADPILADFFNDGDLDLLVHVDLNEQLAILGNGYIPAEPLGPGVVNGTYFYSVDDEEGDLELKVTQPPGLEFTADAIEWTVWEENHLGTGKMSPTAVGHGTFALDAIGEADASVVFHEPKLATSKLYHIDMRGVRTIHGVAVEAGPTRVWSFATPTEDVVDLQSAAGDLGVKLRIFLVDELRFLTLLEEEERILTPTTIPTEKIPPIDEPPDPFGD